MAGGGAGGSGAAGLVVVSAATAAVASPADWTVEDITVISPRPFILTPRFLTS